MQFASRCLLIAFCAFVIGCHQARRSQNAAPGNGAVTILMHPNGLDPATSIVVPTPVPAAPTPVALPPGSMSAAAAPSNSEPVADNAALIAQINLENLALGQDFQLAYRHLAANNFPAYSSLITVVQAQAFALADRARALGLETMAQQFEEMASKRDVFSFGKACCVQYFYSTDIVAASAQATQSHYHLTDFAFRIYAQPRNGCTTPLYGCGAPGRFFFANSNACGATMNVSLMGYVCSEKTAAAPNELHHSAAYLEGLHFYCTSELAVEGTVHSGYVRTWSPGFVPN